MAKLHERFIPVDKYDRESCTCEKCEKIRATCRDCDCCNQCCECDYCPLCNLPNGWDLNECTCFQCEECQQIKDEAELVVDDFNYANPSTFDPRVATKVQYVCTKCYKKRSKAAGY